MYSLTWLTILEDTNDPEVAVLALYSSQTRARWDAQICYYCRRGFRFVSFLDLLAPQVTYDCTRSQFHSIFYSTGSFHISVQWLETPNNQCSSQVIGIGRAPAVPLTIVLTTLVLAHTWAIAKRLKLFMKFHGYVNSVIHNGQVSLIRNLSNPCSKKDYVTCNKYNTIYWTDID